MSEASQGPVVMTTAGAVQGRTSGGVHSFLGVPYAAPPTGHDLMRPPKPARPWSRHPAGHRARPDLAQGRLPAAVPEALPRGGHRRGRVPEPERLDPGPGGVRAAGAGLDPRRLVHERVRVGRRLRRHRVRPVRRRVRDHQLPAVRHRVPVPRRRRRQPGPARPAGRAALGPGQHRRVRRRPGAGHRGRRVGRGDERHHAAVHAAGPRACSPRPSRRAGRPRTRWTRRPRGRWRATWPRRWACPRTGRRSPRSRWTGSSRPRPTWWWRCRRRRTRPSGAAWR